MLAIYVSLDLALMRWKTHIGQPLVSMIIFWTVAHYCFKQEKQNLYCMDGNLLKFKINILAVSSNQN